MSADFDPTVALLTIPEVAELLKISVPTVRRLQQRRLIPFFKVGGSIRLTRGDVLSYLMTNRVEAIDLNRNYGSTKT